MSRWPELSPEDYIARYKAKCTFPEGGCWLMPDEGWHPGSRSPKYPEGSYKGRKVRLNRFMLMLTKRPLERHEVACHRCDNHLCINPEHLFIGTQKDNIQDGIAKGRQQFHPSHYTHCKHGHDFAIHGWVNKRGWRQCRECNRLRMRGEEYRKQANERSRLRRAARRLQLNGSEGTK